MWRFVLPRVALLHHHFYRMPRGKHVSFLFALAAVCTMPQPVLADVAAVEPPPLLKQQEECPFYGCPLLPEDVYFNVMVRQALEAMRNQTREQVQSLEGSSLESCGNETTATLTLIGYKGGDPSAQINQDRALVVSPYRVAAQSTKEAPDGTTCRLLGVFDGHAQLGELVSQYVVTELPKLLAKKLEPIYTTQNENTEEATKQALSETFIELDKTAPAEKSGGCTASVILQMGRKVYVANAGDSTSFVAVYHQQSGKTQVIYTSREDKPNLPEERARVQKMGGQVYNPERGTSRVLYTDPMTGYQSGLAMSRSIGDWEAGKVGVIPDPIVDVIDIPNVVEASMEDNKMCVVIDENGDMNMEPCREVGGVDDIYVFAVSATDGMMDFLDPLSIAQTLAPSLYDVNGIHVLTACEMLITSAAAGWQRAKQGRYRDDIAIAVSTVRIPPALRSAGQ